MKMPKGFKEAQELGNFTPLELGGHICTIMQLEETVSRNGKNMVVLSLDIAQGEQKGYYAAQYRADSRAEKRWGCKFYIVIEDKDGNTSKSFKTFTGAVERSNKGFNIDEVWDEDKDKFAAHFKGKAIGGVFGREEYLQDGKQKKMSTKCFYVCDIDTIKRGVEVPEDKLLPVNTSPAMSGFSEISSDDDLPF